jgi:hypothetical protein
MQKASADLEKANAEAASLKDDWDRARLETTLYDQRAKRAYSKWMKAAKGLKDRAERAKDRAALELDLAIEKRKLAWNRYEASTFRVTLAETRLKELEDEKDEAAIRKVIADIQAKLGAPGAAP